MGTEHFGLLISAAAFAAKKHRHQRRKDAEASPYINYPIALAHLLAGEAGIEEVHVLAAALLHDTVRQVPPQIVGAETMRATTVPRRTPTTPEFGELAQVLPS